jgi:hypothetical protein
MLKGSERLDVFIASAALPISVDQNPSGHTQTTGVYLRALANLDFLIL